MAVHWIVMHFCNDSLPKGLLVGNIELVSCCPPQPIPVRVCGRVLLILEPWVIPIRLADLVMYIKRSFQNSIAITRTIAL